MCVRACVRACVGECMRVCACVGVSARAQACVCARVAYLSRMRHAFDILYCHLWPLWLDHIFRYYLIHGATFGKTFWIWNVCFHFLVQLLLEKIYYSKKNPATYCMVITMKTASCKVPVIPVRYQLYFNFLDRFSKKKTQASNFITIRPVRAELFQVDGQTNEDRHYEGNCRFS